MVTHGAESIIRLSFATERQPEASERSRQDQCYNGLTVTVRLKPDGITSITSSCTSESNSFTGSNCVQVYVDGITKL